MVRFPRAHRVLTHAIAERAFPAAVAEVGSRAGARWRAAFGRLTFGPDAQEARPDTIFDLASLTKVIATTTLAMRLAEQGRLGLSDPLCRWLPAWRGEEREDVVLEDLLTHCAGLTSWLPLYRECTGRIETEAAICALPLEYEPRSRSVYSDLGFMLLGFVLENAGSAPLDVQFASSRHLMGADPTSSPIGFDEPLRVGAGEPLDFRPSPAWRDHIAPTEIDPWRGRLLVGEVHDENAWALGGVAGHSGLFGTAGAVGSFARVVLDLASGAGAGTRLARPETVARFTARAEIPGSSRALGWDTMVPTSSCGTKLSPRAFGHTGFTGTSLWIDPEQDLYVVLLTNRVHPTRANEQIRQVRPALHEAVVDDLRNHAAS